MVDLIALDCTCLRQARHPSHRQSSPWMPNGRYVRGGKQVSVIRASHGKAWQRKTTRMASEVLGALHHLTGKDFSPIMSFSEIMLDPWYQEARGPQG